jgi:hypothetical protein
MIPYPYPIPRAFPITEVNPLSVVGYKTFRDGAKSPHLLKPNQLEGTGELECIARLMLIGSTSDEYAADFNVKLKGAEADSATSDSLLSRKLVTVTMVPTRRDGKEAGEPLDRAMDSEGLFRKRSHFLNRWLNLDTGYLIPRSGDKAPVITLTW